MGHDANSDLQDLHPPRFLSLFFAVSSLQSMVSRSCLEDASRRPSIFLENATSERHFSGMYLSARVVACAACVRPSNRGKGLKAHVICCTRFLFLYHLRGQVARFPGGGVVGVSIRWHVERSQRSQLWSVSMQPR